MTGKGRTVVATLVALGIMGGLVVASVPLYALFCKATGFGGTTRVAAGALPESTARTIVVRFDTTVMNGMPWRFKPERTSMTVRLGEPSLALFTAENLSTEPITGTAVFNVTPAKAGPYIDKIQCFCFTQQHLEPGQKAELPVLFYVDPAIAETSGTDDVRTITLSYAFFRAKSDTLTPGIKPQTKTELAPELAPVTAHTHANKGAS